MKKLFAFLIFGISLLSIEIHAQEKPRTIVTTDGEIDDVDSFVRLLLYANEFKLEGLIYSSSMWHYKGDVNGTPFISEMQMTKTIYGQKTSLRWPGTNWMQEMVEAYEQVFPNLKLHDKSYPAPDLLKSMIKIGNIDFEGEMEKQTEGASWIEEKLMDNNPAPIYLQAWGGCNTIARALKNIEDKYVKTPDWKSIQKKVSDKAIIYIIMDQDATYRKYISENWKQVRVFKNDRQFMALAYNWKKTIPFAYHHVLSGKFFRDSVFSGNGPLVNMYYSYGDGKKQAGDDEHVHGDPAGLQKGQWGAFDKYDFLSEGDSPAFLQLIDVGLGAIDNPSWGNWGGRLVKNSSNPNVWADDKTVTDFNPFTQQQDQYYPLSRWIEPMQNDFAARSSWCTRAYRNANHPPVITLNQEQITASPGNKILVKMKVSDPDGNAVNVISWQYDEAGTCKQKVAIQQKGQNLSIILPENAEKGTQLHLIIEARDNGIPALTRYKRLVIQID